MTERYAIFLDDDGDALFGCQKCEEPLFTIDLNSDGPDVPVGKLLREHEEAKHGRKP